MIRKHMTDFRKVGSLVSSYYKEPDVAFEEIQKDIAKMDRKEAQREAARAKKRR
jgi:hypothetical protein